MFSRLKKIYPEDVFIFRDTIKKYNNSLQKLIISNILERKEMKKFLLDDVLFINGDIKSIKLIHDIFNHPNLENEKNIVFEKMIPSAIQFNQTHILKWLLQNGYNKHINITDLCYLSAQYNSFNLFVFLCESNIQFSPDFFRKIITKSRGDSKFVSYLIQHYNLTDYEEFIFHTAIIYNNIKLLYFLFEQSINFEKYVDILLDCIVRKNTSYSFYKFCFLIGLINESRKGIIREKIKELMDDLEINEIPDYLHYVSIKVNFHKFINQTFLPIPDDFPKTNNLICSISLEEINKDEECLICKNCKQFFIKNNIESWWKIVGNIKCPFRCDNPEFYFGKYYKK